MSTRIIYITMSADERQKELAHMDWQAKQIRELKMQLANAVSPDGLEAKARRNWGLYEIMRNICAERAQQISLLLEDNRRLRRIAGRAPGFCASVAARAEADQCRARVGVA